MKKLAVVLVFISPWATADILMRDGASCTIPKGYNAAQFDDVWNKKGMGEFCEFPSKAENDAFLKFLVTSCGAEVEGKYLVEYPVCDEGLGFSPAVQVKPCYELVE
jgi:hypothetical protein